MKVKDLEVNMFLSGVICGIFTVNPSYTCQEVIDIHNRFHRKIKMDVKRENDKIDNSYSQRTEPMNVPVHHDPEKFVFVFSIVPHIDAPTKTPDSTDKETCYRCGTTEDLEYGPDPFAAEMNEDYTPVWECGDCRYESAMDV